LASEQLSHAFKQLEAHDINEIKSGLQLMEQELPTLDDKELGDAISAISSIFFLDTYEYPQFQSVVDRAVETIANQGERVIPHLLGLLGDSDFKVEFNYAIIFGKIGPPAIKPLLKASLQMQDSTERSFIIYSLGKIRDPQVREAIPMLVESLESASKDIRDSAARTLGKIAENVPAEEIDNETVSKVFDALVLAVKDPHSGVRSKAIRSLGKMFRSGYLNGDQTRTLRHEIDILLGRKDYSWDKAFVVRREASEVDEFLPQSNELS
jgi:HEAT repeat protein